MEGLDGQRAVVSGFQLYKDRYASAVQSEEGEIVGWVMTADDNTLWKSKLENFDRIEGYNEDDLENSLYIRIKTKAKLLSPKDCVGKPLGEENQILDTFIYHRPNASKDTPIKSGDWLQREGKDQEEPGCTIF